MLVRLISESSMCGFILILCVRMVFGQASNRRLKAKPNKLLKAGLHVLDRILYIQLVTSQFKGQFTYFNM